jgi:photosystem II stability/assembly factor-like uncharacterized protein
MMLPRLLACCCLLTLSALAWDAGANSKFPAADQLVVDPSDPSHIVLRTTFGVVSSRNAGASWTWVCESAVGYVDFEPPIAVTGDGTILAGLLDGVRVSSVDGCGWSNAAGIGALVVTDVSVSASDPATALAITVEMAQTRYYESSDQAKTFTEIGTPPPAGFAALTVDMAPSDPNRIYLSGLTSDVPPVGRFMRSIDRGQNWESFDIPGSDGIFSPYIAAVHPTDPDVVYLRLDGAPGRLLRSNDGGQQWTEIFKSAVGNLRGFALSPDGAMVAVGTEFDGLFRAPAGSTDFQQLSQLPILCLRWTGAGLYACINEFLYGDGYIIGLSTDDGGSFEQLLELACIEPMECAAGTEAGDSCPAEWPALSEQLGSDSCGVSETDGGTSAGGGQATVPTPPPGDDCDCAYPGAARGGWRGLGLLAAAALAWCRRERRDLASSPRRRLRAR